VTATPCTADRGATSCASSNGRPGRRACGSASTTPFASRTRIKTLAPSTREANARFFDSLDQVPTHCMTQGLGTILEARELVLVAQGSAKADAVAAAVEGPLSSFVPGSALQLHEHATVVVDEEAAAGLQLADYYRLE
jgi:glucosamine-6-phosphate deaminase